jgi:DNA-binding XRE family transcriptional regulator
MAKKQAKRTQLQIKIDILCAEKGITKEQLAEIIGCKRQTLYTWIESNEIKSSKSLLKLAKYSDKNMEFYMFDKEAERVENKMSA